MSITLFNQNNYTSVKYPNEGNPAATIKSSGCGVCAVAMILANLLGAKITIPALAKYSLANGCRASSGTNMVKLAKCMVRDYPELIYTTTNDEEKLKEHLAAGGMAIMNADGNEGCDGIFAMAGHFLAIIGIKDGKPVIADPAYTGSRYQTAYRKQYVTELGGNLVTCDWYVLNMDTKYRNPNYYLFSKKAVAVISTVPATEKTEEEEMVYKDINEVPDWGKAAVQRRIDAKATDGASLTESMVRCWVVEDRINPFYGTLEEVPAYWFDDAEAMVAAGAIMGDGVNQIGMTRTELKSAVVAWRIKKLA